MLNIGNLFLLTNLDDACIVENDDYQHDNHGSIAHIRAFGSLDHDGHGDSRHCLRKQSRMTQKNYRNMGKATGQKDLGLFCASRINNRFDF